MTSTFSISGRRIGYVLAALALLLGGGVLLLVVRGPDVAGASPAVREALRDCRRTLGSPDTDCYREHVERRVREAGIGPALEMVTALAERNPEVGEVGHGFVHAVGIEGYRASGRVHEAFEECTDAFQSGCHHGVIQAYFTARDSVEPEDVRRVCRPYREDGRELLRFQCDHGLGHGLTMYHGHHLPRALEGCDALETRPSRESCYGGAFMENVVHATNPHHPASSIADGRQGRVSVRGGERGASDPGWAPADPDDPHHPCSAVDARYWSACYEMQTSVMLHVNDGHLGKTAADCESAPRGWRETCFRSLGRSISIRAYDDLDRAVRLCRVGAERLRPFCYQGLAHTLMILGTRPFPDVGLELCRRVPESRPPERIRCYLAVGEALLSRIEPAGRRDTCGLAPRPADRNACRIGAGLEDASLEELLRGGGARADAGGGHAER